MLTIHSSMAITGTILSWTITGTILSWTNSWGGGGGRGDWRLGGGGGMRGLKKRLFVPLACSVLVGYGDDDGGMRDGVEEQWNKLKFVEACCAFSLSQSFLC